MAFSYRTPAQLFLSSLASESQNEIVDPCVKRLKYQEKSSSYNYSYNLSDVQKEFCSKIGVPLSISSFQTHPHPYCKTIENFLLFDNLNYYVNNVNIFVSIKYDKYVALTKARHSSPAKLINRIIADRDIIRYGSCSRRKRIDDLQDLGGINQSWFFHDELHHWSFNDLLKFLDTAKPVRVLGTIVCPVEVFSSENSMNPSFYSFEVVDRKHHSVSFIFNPDGSSESSYFQTSHDYWFRFKKIKIGGECYTISFMRSIKCHHLILIEKGDMETNPFYISDGAECINSKIFGFSRTSKYFLPIRYEVLKREVIYLLSLKKPDAQSAAAKLRQLSDDGYSGKELCFFMTLANILSKTSGCFTNVGLLKGVWESLCSVMSDRIESKLCSSYNERHLEKFIMEMEPFKLRYKRVDYPEFDPVFFEAKGCEVEDDFIIARLDELTGGSSKKTKEYDTSYSVSAEGCFLTNFELNKLQSNFRSKRMHGTSHGAFSDFAMNRIESERQESDLFTEISAEENRFYVHGKVESTHFRRDSVKMSTFKKCLVAKRKPTLFLCNYSFNDRYFRVINNGLNRHELEKLKREQRRNDSKLLNLSFDDDSDDVEMLDVDSLEDMDLTFDEEDNLSVKSGSEGLAFSDFHESDVDGFFADYEIDLTKLRSEVITPFTVTEVPLQNVLNDIEGIFKMHALFTNHVGRKSFFCSKVEGLTYGFNKTLYKSVPNDTVINIIEKFSSKLGVKFNSALVQSYSEGASIGFHKDDEKCYDNDPILTLNLKGKASFGVMSNGITETFGFEDTTAFLMGENFQVNNKHSVWGTTEGRLSITLRVQRRDMSGNLIDLDNFKVIQPELSVGSAKNPSIPEDFSERIEKMVNGCFIDALGSHLKMSRADVIFLLISFDRCWVDKVLCDEGVTVEEMMVVLKMLKIPGSIIKDGVINSIPVKGDFESIHLIVSDDHVSINSQPSLGQSVPRSKNLIDLLLKSGANEVFPKFNTESARRLIKSMQEGATGVLLNKFKHTFNEIRASYNRYFVVAGFAGSGKSRGVQNALGLVGNDSSTILSSPRKDLLNDWEEKLSSSLNGEKMLMKLRTFETAIKALTSRKKKGLKTNLIIDEVSLLPGGYLDLCNSLLFEGSTMTMIFDPLQASYYSNKDKSRNLGDVFEPLYGIKSNYLYSTYRFKNFLNFEDLLSKSMTELSEFHLREFAQPEAVRSVIKDPVFLCPSEDKREELKRYGKAYTFGCSQGLTFDFVIISLDMDGVLTSNAQWMVALTRSRRGFAFLNCPSIRRSEFMSKCEGKLISKVLKKSIISKAFIKGLGGRVMSEMNFVESSSEAMIGKTREEFEDTLEGDPWLKSQLLFLELEKQEVTVEEPVRKESPPRTHLAMGSDHMVRIEGAANIRSRESREFRNSSIWSEQFDDFKKVRYGLDNRAETFEAIYPKHSNSDTLTFWAAIKKRLKFSDPLTERRKLENLMATGQSLFDIFRDTYGFKRDSYVNLEEISAEFIEKRLNKSRKLIEAHSERSDPDWPVNHFFLFMKTQLCTKFEKRFTEAKAGQTLACFSHRVLTRFGVPIRAFEKKMRKQLGDNVYIHSGKQLDELNEWAIKYCKDEGTDSDYEAFDRSQDALILAFEIHMLRFFGWDESLIHDYTQIKINLGCRLGNLAIMRFTGEFGTFILNTCCNMLFTCLRYVIHKDTPIAFAGDDMFAPGLLKIRHNREFLLKRFSLRAKVNFSREPIFCGWRMTKYGIVKEPKLVLERFKIAKEKNCFKECLINYCLEVSFAYRLGERLYDVIKNIEDQQCLVRIVVKNKHLLPKSVRSEFESFDHEFGGCESVQEEGECNRVHSFGCGLECNL